ncbi:MAG: DUF1957 domain-containing protein [Firmicutes bacterium]|nr:DUF1957 domain-containing protein [Bacillota bacterium]
MPQGYLSIILHAHLPYVRHPEHQYSLEEKWLYEAITECYIPLLLVMEQLRKDNVDFAFTISISPTLASMLADALLQDRYNHFLIRLLQLVDKEKERTKNDPLFSPLAAMYRERLKEVFDYYHRWGKQLNKAFKHMEYLGNLELITSAATHGYLPLLNLHNEAVYAQIALAVENHTKIYGSPPRGIWLPECAYDYGIDEILAELGIQYFITAAHGVLYASPRPKYGVYSPILTRKGVAVFGRDDESSKQVWSSKEGYPGDYYYREFFRDIGYDLPLEYISDYLHPPGLRGDTGIKYYRITGPTNHKEPYEPDIAREKAAEHAGNFMFNREKQVEHFSAHMDRPPIIVAPYDAELFGHWWFEGPLWLDYLCRKINYDQEHIKLITPGEYLDLNYPLQESTPSPSSWGDKGYHEVWLNGKNDWLYRHLHRAAELMIKLAVDYQFPNQIQEKALNQAARELLLAQSSDWPFIMTTGTMTEYAISRAKSHLINFLRLEKDIRENNINIKWLNHLAEKNSIFPHLDYRVYYKTENSVKVPVGVM